MTLTTRAMQTIGTNLLHSICLPAALLLEMFSAMTTEVVIEANETFATWFEPRAPHECGGCGPRTGGVIDSPGVAQ